MDFPKTITRELLVEKGACEEGLKAFDAAYPPGSIHYSKSIHKQWLHENAEFEVWAVEGNVCAPLDSRAGDYGTAQAGYAGTAQAGYAGTAQAGYAGTATAGNYGTATAGCHGTATAGKCGTAQAGNYGTAQAGKGGTAQAGDFGILKISYWDGRWRLRWAVAYVGEDGILPSTPYRLDESHNFVPA